MTEDLRRRVVRAVGATSLGSGLAKLISLGSTLALVRLLVPEDFGLMAMASTVTGFVGFFNEFGIGAAIVQRADTRDEEINGCFGIAIIASTILCALVIGLSWPAAAYFGMPKLRMLLAVLGFGFFFGALNTVPIALLRKDLRFQAVLWVGIGATAVQALVAVLLAIRGMGYWSIVGGFFVGQATTTFGYWRVSKWRPHLPFRLKEGRALLGYGVGITLTRVLWHTYMNVDKLIIGKLLGERSVGVYDVSRSLASLPTSQITGLVTGIASPVFSRVQADPSRLKAVLLRLTRGVAYVTFPLLAGMSVLSTELVQVLLGAKWHDAVVPLQLLCISEAVATITNLQAQLLISTGHVKRLVRFNAICTLVMPVSVAVGAWQGGVSGVALAWAIMYPVLANWLLHEALRTTGLTYREFWHAVRQPFAGSLVMTVVVVAVHAALVPVGLPAVVVLLGCVAIGAAVYTGYFVAIDRSGLEELRQVLADLGIPDRFLDRWPFRRTLASREKS